MLIAQKYEKFDATPFFFKKLGISSLEGIKPHHLHNSRALKMAVWRQVFSPMAPTRTANWDTRTPTPALWRVSRTYGRPIRRAQKELDEFWMADVGSP